MLKTLIVMPRVLFNGSLIALNTLVHATPLFLLALIKAMVPVRAFRTWVSRILVVLAESWIAVNSRLMRWLVGFQARVSDLPELDRHGTYLVICNHASFVDIPALQMVFNRRIPFLRFFLKSELIWVPVLGLAWWALDFPFMKRYTKSQLARNPALAGKDREATRIACEKYRHLPVSIMNFVEGTRFTREKQARRNSPYTNLLAPRSGGIAYVFEAMGDMLDGVIDVSLAYPMESPSAVDLFAGRVRQVEVKVEVMPVPAELLGGDYSGDVEYRKRFQTWLNGRWRIKDQWIQSHRQA